MARLLIPTRNRPTSLSSVIGFLERFYPGTEVIVADGSSDAFAEANRAAMTAPERRGLVEYRRYPYEMPLHARILDVLGDIDDPFIVMGSDDDYPFMDTLARAEERLVARPAAATAMGAKLSFTMYGPQEVTAQLIVSRMIAGPDVRSRAIAFSRWPFSTTYAVTRREVLIERFERAQQIFLTGFYDFGVGLHDAACGDIVALPEFCFVMTRNFTHSYLRREGYLNFVHRADEVLKQHAFLVEDLVRRGGLSAEEARHLADELYERKIVGGRFSARRNFQASAAYTNELVQAEIGLFENVFRAGTAEREAYADRLGFILEALAATSGSDDNRGEDKEVETLDRQMEAGRAAASRGEVPSQAYTRYRGGKRYRDPFKLVRRVDPATLTWIDDGASGLHILVLGESFGAAGARFSPAAARGENDVWSLVAGRLAGASGPAAVHVSSPPREGAAIEDWQAGAADALAALAGPSGEGAMPPQFVVWNVGGAAGEGYEATFDSVHEALAEALPDAAILVCRSAAGEAVRAAQEAIIGRYANTLPGPDLALCRRLAGSGEGAADSELLATLLFEALREPVRAWQRAQSAQVPPLRPRSGRGRRSRGGRVRGGGGPRRRSPDAPTD